MSFPIHLSGVVVVFFHESADASSIYEKRCERMKEDACLSHFYIAKGGGSLCCWGREQKFLQAVILVVPMDPLLHPTL